MVVLFLKRAKFGFVALSVRQKQSVTNYPWRRDMKSEEFGEVVFNFESEYGFNPHLSNAGGSGSQGGCGGSGGCGGGGGCSGGSGSHNTLTEDQSSDK